MRLNKPIIASGLAGLMIVASAAAAFAAPAVATRSVSVRNGPGTFFRVVDRLHPGELVDVQGCRRGWCYVSKRGPDGWVSAAYLRSPAHRPYFNFRFDFGHTPKFPGGWDNHGPGNWPGRPGGPGNWPGGPGGPGNWPGGPGDDNHHPHDNNNNNTM